MIEQQIEQDQGFAGPRHESPAPVKDSAGNPVRFQFHHGRILLFLLGRAQVVHRGGRLALLQSQRPGGQSEMPSSECNGAGGHQDDLLAPTVQAQQIRAQCFQPGAIQPPGPGVDQQRRTDLDDDTPCGRQRAG